MASETGEARGPRGMSLWTVVTVSLLITVVACAILMYPSVSISFDSIDSVQTMRVSRYAHMAVDSFHAIETVELGVAPPFDKVVTDAHTAQALYDAAFALPGYQTINGCPPTRGAAYQLAFSQRGAPVLTITVSECYEVSLGNLGNRMWDASFEGRLAKALNLDEAVMWDLSPESP